MSFFRKIIIRLRFFPIVLLLIRCDKSPIENNDAINTNIVELDIPSTNNFVAVGNGNNIYSVTPPYHFRIDENYKVIETNELPVPWGNWTYIDINEIGTKLLLVKSNYWDLSSGALYEFDIQSKLLTLLKDSTHNVSSAVYWVGDDNKIIYYKYGEPRGTEPGYYHLNLITKKDSLILSYISPDEGGGELVNGFDLHPNNDRLLIPLCQSKLLHIETPKVGIYYFGSDLIDTLSLEFDNSYVRTGIWTRYNYDGSQILYCVYPHGAYTSTTNDDSEVGIIEYPSLKKRVLDINTNGSSTKRSIQLAPNWSHDFQSIIYGSGRLTIEGAAGRRRLYILKKIN